MAEIRPLKGWRYGPPLVTNIADLTSPVFDVVSEKQREALYQHPYNSIHLSVPKGPEPGQPGGCFTAAVERKRSICSKMFCRLFMCITNISGCRAAPRILPQRFYVPYPDL